MGSFDKLEIGRRSLFAAQMGQRTAGQNIANVNTEGYKKRVLDQSDFYSEKTGKMNGVSVDGIKRSQDEFLERQLLFANSEFKNESARSEVLRNLEVIYNDRNGRGLSNLITEHFGAWDELATTPESLPLRQQLVTRAVKLTDKFNTLYTQTREYRKDLINDIQADIQDINRWAEEIGILNYKIVKLEAMGGDTNGLKDDRDRLANMISDKVDIQRSYNKNGRLHLQTGNGHALVDGDQAYKLKFNHDKDGTDKVSVNLQLQDTSELDITDFIKQGSTREKVRMVNEYIPETLGKLDNLADTIRFAVNREYSTGTMANRAFDKLESASTLPPEFIRQRIHQLGNGHISFKITDKDGDVTDTVSVQIDAYDTAETAAYKINSAMNINSDNNAPNKNYLTAGIVDGKFQLNARQDYKFYIAEDTVSLAAKLGLNVFFAGHYGAEDMKVNSSLISNPETIAAGRDMLPGDNKVALNIGDLRRAVPMNQGTETFDEYYDKFSSALALDLQTSQKKGELKKETLDQYNVMREEISGVSLDEEMANITRYQRAYEASAKFSSAADEMLQTVINMR